MTNICFITGHAFGARALAGLLDGASAHDGGGDLSISPLITLSDLKSGDTVGYHAFGELAANVTIDHVSTSSIREEGIEALIESARPDYLMVIGWSELLPSPLLDIPKRVRQATQRHGSGHGCIGMHPTLLPRGRGRAPIPWTILKGLTESGVTAFLLEEEADAGGIVLQDPFKVDPYETATTLFQKAADSHYTLGYRLAPLLLAAELSSQPQDESAATVWPKRRPSDGIIDFTRTSDDISRLVRALAPPYPSAYFVYGDKSIAVRDVTIVRDPNEHDLPGTIVAVPQSDTPYIRAADGVLACTLDCAHGVAFRVGDRISIGEPLPEAATPPAQNSEVT
jgi:methionyl-tRNA formyltransferase